MKEQRRTGHSVTILMVHLVWVTKYRYPVLKGDVQKRCRELLIQTCDAEAVRILKGVVSKDYVHMHIGYPVRSSRILQDEFPELKKRYWGRCFWAIGYDG